MILRTLTSPSRRGLLSPNLEDYTSAMAFDWQNSPVSTPQEIPQAKRRSVHNFFASVRYAIDGFFAALKHEPSFREGLAFALLLTPLAIILPINAVSTALMISALILILIVEMINSAIEWTIDYIRPEIHPLAKRVKDMASAAVFLSYINCIVIWVIMLWPGNAVWQRLENWLVSQF